MYNVKLDCSAAKKVIADDMILTKGVATTAGSKMLEGYQGLFDAEVITRLTNASMNYLADTGRLECEARDAKLYYRVRAAEKETDK